MFPSACRANTDGGSPLVDEVDHAKRRNHDTIFIAIQTQSQEHGG
jgi:hypothetical protein